MFVNLWLSTSIANYRIYEYFAIIVLYETSR